MAGALPKSGLRLGGEITQGLKQADLFELVPPDRSKTAPRGGGGGGGGPGPREAAGGAGAPLVVPRLRALDVPVRAVVLPLLDHEAAHQLHDAAAAQLRPLLGEGSVYWQDPWLLHSTVYHASTHGVGAAVRRRALATA